MSFYSDGDEIYLAEGMVMSNGETKLKIISIPDEDESYAKIEINDEYREMDIEDLAELIYELDLEVILN